MNIKREGIGPLNELITIELLASDYQEQVAKSLKDLKQKARVPGFRPGHVPMGMIEKMYKKAVILEEVSKMTNDEIYKYLTENMSNLLFDPIACGEKTKGDFENPDNFNFSFEIGLRPEIAIDYAEAKKVPFHKIIASEEEVDKEVMDMRMRVGKFSSTEEVAEHDLLIVSVKPDGEGEEFTSSLLLDYLKEADAKSFIGKKLYEEITIDTTQLFKDDSERANFLKVKPEELGNALKTVHIKINAIHHRDFAEINDDFFARIFPDGSITDEAALRNVIKRRIELRYVNEANALYYNKVLTIFMGQTPVALPDAFIKRYLVENKHQYTAESVEEKYDSIQKSIVYQLVEDQIANDCNIAIEEEEVTQYMEDYIRLSHFGTIARMGKEEEKQIAIFVEQMKKNQENTKNAYDNLFREKITEGLKIRLQSKQKELTFKEFLTELSAETEEKSKTAIKKEKKTAVAEEKPKTDQETEEKSKVTRTKTKKKVEAE